jgi:hypothetical protein
MNDDEMAELATLSQARAGQPLTMKELALLVKLTKPKKQPKEKLPADPLARPRRRAAALRSQIMCYEASIKRIPPTKPNLSEPGYREYWAASWSAIGAQSELEPIRLSLACLLRDYPSFATDDMERAWAADYLAGVARWRAEGCIKKRTWS